MITCAWFLSLHRAIAIGQVSPFFVVDRELLFFLRMGSAVPSFIIWQIAVMQRALLDDVRSVRQAIVRSWPWLIISTGLACLAFSESFIPSHSTPALKLRGPAYPVFHISIAICGVWILADSVRRMKSLRGIKKLEFQFFVSNAVFASLLVILSSLAAHILPEIGWLRRTAPIWITAWQGSIIWAICYYKVFEANQMISLVGHRLTLWSLLGAIALGLIEVLQQGTREMPATLSVIMAAIGLAVIGDQPMRRWFGLDAKQRLEQPRSKIIKWVREGLDEEQLVVRMEELLRNWCQTDHVRLFTLNENAAKGTTPFTKDEPGLVVITRLGWITPEALQRQKESAGTRACEAFLERENLGALLTVPKGSPSPSLLVALGRKHSLRPFTYPDIQLLLELAELMDNTLTHSRMAAHTARLERMESAAMMSRGLAHDLNNLAMPVSTFLLHMEPRVAPDTPEADVLRDAKHSVRVMQDYIRESLFFTRRLVPDFRPVDAVELMQSVLKLTQARAQARGVSVVLGNMPNVPLTADSALIQRLLQNLVFNGIDATPRGGTVTLAVEPMGGERICFSVTDEGPGVPPSLKERIFDPYFTTKDTGDDVRGLGLGLAICRKICDLHHGEIEVGSAPGRGAVFTVKLPVAPRPSDLLPVSKSLTVR